MSASAFSQKALPQLYAADDAKTVRFFPNPASTTITFELKEPAEHGTVLQVFSFLGRQVLSIPVTGNRITVNVTDLIKGVYIFQLRTSNGRVIETNKFQVSR